MNIDPRQRKELLKHMILSEQDEFALYHTYFM